MKCNIVLIILLFISCNLFSQIYYPNYHTPLEINSLNLETLIKELIFNNNEILKNKKIELKVINSKSQKEESTKISLDSEYWYDSMGSRIKQINYNYFNNVNTMSDTTFFKYDSAHRLIEEYTILSKNVSYKKITYLEKKIICITTTIDRNRDTTFYMSEEYLYNADNVLITKKVEVGNQCNFSKFETRNSFTTQIAFRNCFDSLITSISHAIDLSKTNIQYILIYPSNLSDNTLITYSENGYVKSIYSSQINLYPQFAEFIYNNDHQIKEIIIYKEMPATEFNKLLRYNAIQKIIRISYTENQFNNY